MTVDSGTVPKHQALHTPSKGRGRLPPGCRTLYAYVPEAIFNRAKALAVLSGLRLTEYVVQLLEEAQRIAEVADIGRQAIVPCTDDAASGRR